MGTLMLVLTAAVVIAAACWRWEDIAVRVRNASLGPARVSHAAVRALRRSRLPDVDGSGGTVADLYRVYVPVAMWDVVRGIVPTLEEDLALHLAKASFDLDATVRSDIVVKVVKGSQRQWRVKVVAKRTAASGKVLVDLEPSAGGYPVLLDRPTSLVGRDPAHADLLLNIDTVTRKHARVTVDGEVVEVTDLGSTNGTWVNDRRVKPAETVRVRSGDWLSFADQEFRVVVHTPVAMTDAVVDVGAARCVRPGGGTTEPLGVGK